MKIRKNQVSYVIGDIACATGAVLLTFGLRSNWTAFTFLAPEFIIACCIYCSLFTVIAGLVLGSYNSIWVYIGFSELFKQALIVTLHAIAAIILKTFFIQVLTYSDIILFWGILLFLTCGIRAFSRCQRWIRANREAKIGHAKKAIIIGAGAAGAMIIKRLSSNIADRIYPVAVLDDDDSKQGIRVCGISVCGKVRDVARIAEKVSADTIIIAIPSATSAQLESIYEHCIEAHIPIKIFQSVVDGTSFMRNKQLPLTEVPIEELLCRDAVKPETEKIRAFIHHKTVLVTGGAGSIGSELCRQVLQYGCRKLIIYDINENGMFSLSEELKEQFQPDQYVLCIGSIQDEARLNQIFSTHQPDLVFHAAAHKHVPMMEQNPAEAVKNNVFGTRNVIQACIKHHTSRFVLISTDKAVHPSSIMGATKRIAELQAQAMNGNGCELAAVRFGNVLGSNGSVVPTFKKQIAQGGPVTVTHQDIERFFMTIPEAVSLVLCAGAQAEGGEIFVLDMGNPIRIYDLACRMIRLAGLEPEKDIPIKITGLRPGEKLFEELSLGSETVQKTESEKIFVLRDRSPILSELDLWLDRLHKMILYGAPTSSLCETLFDMADARTQSDNSLSDLAISDRRSSDKRLSENESAAHNVSAAV